MKSHSRGASAAAFALLVAAVALPQSAGAAALPARPASAPSAGIQWAPCPPPPPGLPDGGQQCTTVQVPMDYSDPGGRTMGIAVSRIPAADPALRRGVLLVNPGGPGGPGLDLPRLLGLLMAQDIRDRYDLIGFDPRFIGRSEAVA